MNEGCQKYARTKASHTARYGKRPVQPISLSTPEVVFKFKRRCDTAHGQGAAIGIIAE